MGTDLLTEKFISEYWAWQAEQYGKYQVQLEALPKDEQERIGVYDAFNTYFYDALSNLGNALGYCSRREMRITKWLIGLALKVLSAIPEYDSSVEAAERRIGG